MYLTEHAQQRLTERLGVAGLDLVLALEERPGERGTVAYLLDDQHGCTVVAIAVDGSIETVYLRRPEQDMRASAFGLAHKVIDMRGDR